MTEDNAVLVHVQMTREDALELLHAVYNRDPAFRPYPLMTFVAILFFVSSVFAPSWFVESTNRNWSVGLVALVGIMPLALVRYFEMRTVLNVGLDPQGIIMRPHEFVVSTRGASLKNDVVDVKYSWRAFLRFEETPTHFFLLIDRQMGYVVPKRNFTSAEESSRFGAMLRANIKPAKPSPWQ